jgi:hypothetical protein
MTDLINFFPSLLLGAMVALTLLLLPLLDDDRQRTDTLRLPPRERRPNPRDHQDP